MELFSSKEGLCFQQLITYPEIKINADCFSFITGKSGCGKSTYLRMLSATLSAPDGQIFYRSKPLEDYPVLDYRKEVMLVPQQVFLFDGTIRENFDLFYDMREEKQPLDEDVQRFLSICCADFPLSANCATLSGGERQRVFLAIFLSAMPKVLLLDEPTAALDPLAEADMYQKYHELTKEKTSVFISHRLSSTQFCDRVFYLENGKIVEEGTHQQLMQQGGQYAKMFAYQAYYYQKKLGAKPDEE